MGMIRTCTLGCAMIVIVGTNQVLLLGFKDRLTGMLVFFFFRE
jgi:hypothetical protein